MECINFDEHFEHYAMEWMQSNAAKYKRNMDRMEAKMPDVYLQWLNKPADWLDGISPGAYFLQYNNACELVHWMIEYFMHKVPVPDQLLERITSLDTDAERALMGMLEEGAAPVEAVLTAISLLGEMESCAPMEKYIAWIAARGEADERADMAAEALTAMGIRTVAPILNTVRDATCHGRETFLDILCNFPGDPGIFTLAIDMFHELPQKRALMVSLLGKLGDEHALPALQEAVNDRTLSYLDFIELRNAIEALGGDAPAERDFSGDPTYESMRRID